VRKQPPSTATTHDLEDSVKDLAQGTHPRPSGDFRGREMGLYVGPLGIGEVGRVGLSHACWSSGLLLNNPFSDGFRRFVLGSSKIGSAGRC